MKMQTALRGAALGAAMLASSGALALDNTQKTEFWDTTAYVNVDASAVTSTPLDATFNTPFCVGANLTGSPCGAVDATWFSWLATDPLGTFDTIAPGLIFILK